MPASLRTQTSTPPSSPAPLPFERHSSAIAPSNQAPRSGTVIPNRIFVGGIDSKTSERDLAQLFSQHGAVTEVKIILTRTGMSKGYGFVTFETEEDANKMLDDPNRFYINDKKLNISQAVLKHRVPVRVSRNVQEPSHVMPAPSASSYHITPSGHPYTYHNGTAYFPSSNVNPTTHYWPSASGTAMMPPPQPQPIWHQQTYHQYQTPVPPGPEGMDQATNGGIIQPLMPFAGASIPEIVFAKVTVDIEMPQRSRGQRCF
ncbi:protein boule-like [Lampris incognitus]|uniref:protein boule-like n=1 Tax=Lampris incognitus TaxID=2546036 RepID=UPI0024B5A442|nr:protein boule-like [Lampris incognitus]